MKIFWRASTTAYKSKWQTRKNILQVIVREKADFSYIKSLYKTLRKKTINAIEKNKFNREFTSEDI